VDEKYGYACSTHCCKWHGCKYGYGKHNSNTNKLCAVVDGGVEQEYPCEYCSMDWEEFIKSPGFDPEWIAYIQKWESEGGHL